MKKTCGCCISTILFIIIAVVGIFFGGSYYAYEKYGKQYVGLSYGEVLGLIPGLYSAKEKKIVTAPFNETEDLASFEKKMKAAMFVSADSEFSIKGMLEQLLSKTTTPEQPQEPTPQVDTTVEPLLEQPQEPTAGANGSDNAFLGLLKDLNFDFSSLKDYDKLTQEAKKASGVVSAKDTELAALFSSAFTTILSAQGDSDMMAMLTKTLQVKQVIISTGEEQLDTNVRMKATIKLDIKALIEDILSKQNLPSIVTSIAKTIIPKAFFLTVEVAPFDMTSKPSISVNEYSDKNNQRIMTLLTNVMSTVGGQDITAMLDTVDGYIKNVFAKVKSMVDLKFVGDSAELDAIYGLMSAMQLNVHKEDFLEMISFLNCRDLTALQGKDYEKDKVNQFMIDFKENYAVADSLDINKDNFTKEIGKVPNNIDTAKLKLDKNNSQVTTVLSYDAMIPIIEKEMKGTVPSETQPVADTKGAVDIFTSIEIKNISFIESEGDKQRLSIVISLQLHQLLAEMMKDNTAMLELAQKLLPEQMFITFQINMNVEKVADLINGQPQLDDNGNVITKYKYAPEAELLINDLDQEQTVKMLATFQQITLRFGGESASSQVNHDQLKAKLTTQLRSTIENLQNQESGKIKIKFFAGGMQLPTVYELMQSMFGVTSEVYTKEQLPDQIRLAIKGMQEEAKIEAEKNIKHTSNAIENSDKIETAFHPIDPQNDLYYRVVDGKKRYYVDISSDLAIYDKSVNQIMSQPITTSGAIISLKQTVFVDTTLEDGEVMKDSHFKGLVTSSGFAGQLVIQSAMVDISGMTTVKNPLIPKDLYMTYVYDTTTDIENVDNGVMVILNNMTKEQTHIIEQIIAGAQKKPFSFNDIINKALENSIKKPIDVNMPQVSVSGVVIMPAKKTTVEFSELLKLTQVVYVDKATSESEWVKGTSKLVLSQRADNEIPFDTLTPGQQRIIEAMCNERP